MGRRTRQIQPPASSDKGKSRWDRRSEGALNTLPPFSLFSTSDGPESSITADSGTIGIDVGSSATTFWAKAAGNGQTGWLEITLQ